MGGAQSASGHANNVSSSLSVAKTSYYELLEIERTANDIEIKKAYRKKALELHPDRNYGNVDEATRLFADVQTAYEVLSDPQERSWYDSHESAILRGDDIGGDAATSGPDSYDLHDVKFASGDDVVHLMGRFGGGVKFSDETNGFFGFLRQTFNQLAQEEEAAALQTLTDPTDIPDYPTFGTKADTHEGVVKAFYAAWTGFATRKSFAWRDKYKLSEAPDRRYKRMMEKENKKFRDEGMREFNDAVRSLVAFVRKRDPRYTANAQSEAERQQTLRDAAAAQAARARAANQAALAADVPSWTQPGAGHLGSDNDDENDDEVGREQTGTFEDSEDDEEEEASEQFECVACNKSFKSENQWQAHERSKKHQKAVKALRKQMRREGIDLDLEGEENSSGFATPNLEVEAAAAAADGSDHVDTKSANDSIDADLEILQLSEDSSSASLSNTVADQPTQEQNQHQKQSDTDNDTPSQDTSHDDTTPDTQPLDPQDGTKTNTDNDNTPPGPEQIPIPNLDSSDDDFSHTTSSKPKKGKAAQKRAKKAAAAAAAAAAANNDAGGGGNKQAECATCHASFPSKTRLFQHIKDHGHAAPKGTGGSGTSRKKGHRG